MKSKRGKIDVCRTGKEQLELNNGITRLVFKQGLFDFTDVSGNIGWHKMSFHTLFNGGWNSESADADKFKVSDDSRDIDDRIGKGVQLRLTFSNRKDYPDEEYIFWMYEGKPVLIFQHNIANKTGKDFFIDYCQDFSTRARDCGRRRDAFLSLGRSVRDLFQFHTENMRKMVRHEAIRGNKACRGLTDYTMIGDTVDLQFPGLFVGSRKTPIGVVDGVLSQNRCYRVYELGLDGCPRSDSKIQVYNPIMNTRGVAGISLKPGEKHMGEKVYLEIADTNDIRHIFDNYIKTLKSVCNFRGQRSDLRYHPLWCSWYQGVSKNSNEKVVLDNAAFIRDNFPTIKWIQLDAGYQRGYQDDHRQPGMCWAYDGEEGIDKKRFPHGMKYLADNIKQMGLRPAFWIGQNTVSPCSRLVKEHPEWILRKNNGQPFYHAYGGNSLILDPSVPAVQDFLHNALTMIIKDWGFEGIKLDIWTYAFEMLDNMYAERTKTSLELREWLLKEIRSLLPDYGFLQLGTDLSSGNPFAAKYSDNFAFEIDFNNTWEGTVLSARWMAPLLFTAWNEISLPILDIAPFPEMEDGAFRVRATLCMVGSAMIGVDGDMPRSAKSHPQRIEWMKKVLAYVDNGRQVYFGDPDKIDSDLPPTIWYIKGNMLPVEDPRSTRSQVFVAIFNWNDQELNQELSFAAISLDEKKTYRFIDFWDDKEMNINGSAARIKVPPRDVKAFQVISDGKVK